MIEMSLNQFDSKFANASQSAHANAANLAKYFLSTGKPSSALRLVLEVLKANSKDVAALTLAGIACRELKDPAKALHLYSNALAQTGPDPILLGFKADSLNLLCRFREAISAVEEANTIDETLPANHLHMGTALMELDKFEEAEACFKTALKLKSDYTPAMINLGLIAHNRLEFELALKYYDQVINMGGANPNLDWNDVNLAKWNKSHILLSLGDYQNGLPLFEARSVHGDVKSRPKKIPGKMWDGKTSTVGKRILIHCEGGFGDTIQFVRYADCFEAGSEVIILCQKSLFRLIKRNFPSASVIAVGDELPEFDFHCPMMSLPMAFGTQLSSIPEHKNYYSVDDSSVRIWGKYFERKKGLKVGIVAKGSSTFKNDRNRSVRLVDLLKSLPADNTYVLLQKDISKEEQKTLLSFDNVFAPADKLTDFYDTAALCAHLDVVVSVDTAVAHLSASSGVSTAILLPYRADWRWGVSGKTSPWYNSARLFRQNDYQDWFPVFNQVSHYLRNLKSKERDMA